jgi:hypothetical protein
MARAAFLALALAATAGATPFFKAHEDLGSVDKRAPRRKRDRKE